MRLPAVGFTLPWQLVAAQEPGRCISSVHGGRLRIRPPAIRKTQSGLLCGHELPRQREADRRQPHPANRIFHLDLQDKHSRAYQALTGDVGERMARILKLGRSGRIAEMPRMHALYPKPEQARPKI